MAGRNKFKPYTVEEAAHDRDQSIKTTQCRQLCTPLCWFLCQIYRDSPILFWTFMLRLLVNTSNPYIFSRSIAENKSRDICPYPVDGVPVEEHRPQALHSSRPAHARQYYLVRLCRDNVTRFLTLFGVKNTFFLISVCAKIFARKNVHRRSRWPRGHANFKLCKRLSVKNRGRKSRDTVPLNKMSIVLN